jgi:hypothetical protein
MHGGRPLADGEGQRNAYFVGPDLGPDGYFHMIWVWRETPSAATNRDLTYARSRDLETWETSAGQAISLPMRWQTGDVVDATAPGGGLLNGQMRLGFDSRQRPMITYLKYDQAGQTQIFLARPRARGGWQSYQITQWTGSRLELDRQGSLSNNIGVSEAPRIGGDGSILVRASREGQTYEWRVDPNSHRVLAEERLNPLPPEIQAERERRDMPMFIMRPRGTASGPMAGVDWYATWHATGSNQDVARDEIPAPSTLRLHPIRRASGN